MLRQLLFNNVQLPLLGNLSLNTNEKLYVNTAPTNTMTHEIYIHKQNNGNTAKAP